MSDSLNYTNWLNKSSIETDNVSISPIWGFYDVLNVHCKPPVFGDSIPTGSHWCLFHPHVPMQNVGEDGHPKRGDFMPDPPDLPRRMFAGSAISFHHNIKIGDQVKKEQTIKSISEKNGKTGKLLFVKLEEKYSVEDKICITQLNDIVYREAPNNINNRVNVNTGKKLDTKIMDSVSRKEITPDPVMLFKYSSITFNGHRIHYDRKYSKEIEGYPGLIVHGPLTATLLMQFCEDNFNKKLAEFKFRAIKPIFDIEKFYLNLFENINNEIEVYATNSKDEVCMSGSAIIK